MLLFCSCTDVDILVSCSSIGCNDIATASDMSFASVVCSCYIALVTSVMDNIWDGSLVVVLDQTPTLSYWGLLFGHSSFALDVDPIIALAYDHGFWGSLF
jgi:hypothetical protein